MISRSAAIVTNTLKGTVNLCFELLMLARPTVHNIEKKRSNGERMGFLLHAFLGITSFEVGNSHSVNRLHSVQVFVGYRVAKTLA